MVSALLLGVDGGKAALMADSMLKTGFMRIS